MQQQAAPIMTVMHVDVKVRIARCGIEKIESNRTEQAVSFRLEEEIAVVLEFSSRAKAIVVTNEQVARDNQSEILDVLVQRFDYERLVTVLQLLERREAVDARHLRPNAVVTQVIEEGRQAEVCTLAFPLNTHRF